MAGIFDYGSVLYDVDDLKIARSNSDGTYGTLIDVPSIDMFRIEWVLKAATAQGDGGETAQASAIISAQITMRNVSIKRDQFAAMYPADVYNYGTTPNQNSILDIESGRPFPYFGAIARVFDGEDDQAGALIFVPRMKIMNNLTWNIEWNTFITPEVTAKALRHPSLVNASGRQRFVRVRFYEGGASAPLPQITTMPI